MTMVDGSSRPTRVRWMVFGLACATSWLLYLHRYAWGQIKSDVKVEFQLTDAQTGWIDSAFMAAYTVAQIPTGLMGDRLGPAVVLPIIIFTWSVLVAVLSWAGGFSQLAATYGLFGVAQAGAYPNLIKVTRSWFPASIRTSIQGLIASTAGRSGGACSAIVLSTLLMGLLGLSWRSGLAAMALGGIAFAVVFRFLFRDDPTRHPWTNAAEWRLIRYGESSTSVTKRNGFTRHAAAWLSFAALLVQQITSAFADMLYVFWIPLFLQEAKHLDRIELGIFASLPLWGGAIGGMAGGMLNDVCTRLVGRRLARSMVGCGGKIVAALFVALGLYAEDGRTVMVILAGAKFFADWSQPTVWGTVTDMSGRLSGSVFGAVNMTGAIGAFLAGPILGHVKQSHGWGTLFGVIIAVYTVSGLCWLWVDSTKRIVEEDDAHSMTPRMD